MRLLVDIIELMKEITTISFNVVYVFAMFSSNCFTTLYVGRVCLGTM